MFNTNKRANSVMEWCLPSPKWIFITNSFLLLLHVSVAKTLEPINWDKFIFVSHPGGLSINASINDVIDVICPQSSSTPEQQYHTFTQVTKQAYERCDLSMGRPKTLLRCNRPALPIELRLLFQEHTAFPGDPIFKHGLDYYFITTADGTPDGINQPSGGLCETHNMKLKIHVNGDAVTDIPSSSTQSTPVQRTKPSTTVPTRRTLSPRISTKVTTTVKPTRRKPISEKMPDKTSENDSLTGDGGNRSSTLCPSSLLLILCSTVAFIRWLRC